MKVELLDKTREHLKEHSLRELSREIEVRSGKRYSPSYISLVINGKYQRDTTEFESALSRVFRSDKLSYRDRRKLVTIKLILQEADNPDAIRSALTT